MTLDWLHLIILLGAVQGVILAAVLATKRTNRTANRLLAAAMLGFSIYLLDSAYYAAGLEQRFPHFFGIAYPMPLLYGPVIYLYAVTASDRTRRLTWRDGWHFLPFAAVIVAGLPIYLMSGAGKIALYRRMQQGYLPTLLRIADPLKYVSGISYAAATLLFLRRHHARIKDNYSSIERVNLAWLLWLAVAAAAIWVLATVSNVTHQGGRDDLVALALAIVVYGIGYQALRQPEIFDFTARDYRPAMPVNETPAEPRYERSGLTEREAAALKDAVLRVMESDRLYQNSELTLADLAERLGTTPHKLSEVLNSQLEQTFYDFVNAYRVRDVQRRIVDERWKNLTILSLALEAGFASKSTFNQVFKQHTGRTPSTYRSSLSR
ncbi:MAG: helix-turn-helix domain-containing protein [Gemmatimonadota bacterium]